MTGKTDFNSFWVNFGKYKSNNGVIDSNPMYIIQPSNKHAERLNKEVLQINWKNNGEAGKSMPSVNIVLRISSNLYNIW